MIVYLTIRTMTTQMINLSDISPPPMVDWIAHPDPNVGVVDNGVWRYKTDEEQIEGEIILIGREYLKEIEEGALSYWIEYNHKGLKIDGGYIEEEWLDE